MYHLLRAKSCLHFYMTIQSSRLCSEVGTVISLALWQYQKVDLQSSPEKLN